MSSAADAPLSRRTRRPLPWARTLIVAATVVAAWAATSALPRPWRAVELRLLDVALGPTLALVAVLLAALAVGVILRAGTPGALPAATAEEPLPVAAGLGAVGAPVPVVALAGVEPGCGVSTLTFNVAVALAVQGIRSTDGGLRRPRPACVLADGLLSAALGLTPDGLEACMGDRPYKATPDLVNAGVRHASGCVLFCLRRDEAAPARLRALLGELRARFDAVLVDAALPERELSYLVADLCDLLVLVALPGRTAVETVGGWIERVWGMGLETRTGLVLNRVLAWPKPERELQMAFLHHAEIPEQPEIGAFDLRGLPWSLDERLHAARALTVIARQVFSALIPGEDGRAA